VRAGTTRSCWSVSRHPCTRRHASGGVFDCEIAEDSPGMMVLNISGENASKRFRPESGGHRWQRVPPNARGGEVHSSTVTVAVMPVPRSIGTVFRECDCDIQTCRGSGPGGQKRNKTETAVQVKHRPTGLMVRCDSERSQSQNKQTAFAILAARLTSSAQSKMQSAERDDRRRQVGSGERSDKVRTVQVKNGVVFSSKTSRKIRLADYLKGFLDHIQDES